MRIVFSLFVLITGALGFDAAARPAIKTISIAADVWCPINCAKEDPELGIAVDVIKAVFEPQGYRVDYVIMPWSRALEQARLGKIDAVIGANPSEAKMLRLSLYPIYGSSDDFYMLSGIPFDFRTVASLQGKRLGIIRDYSYGESVRNFIEDNRRRPGIVQEADGDNALNENIEKLLAGQIDVIIEYMPVMEYRLKQKNLGDRIRRVGGIGQDFVYVAFSPNLPDTQEKIRIYDEGVAALKASGALTALYARYGLRL